MREGRLMFRCLAAVASVCVATAVPLPVADGGPLRPGSYRLRLTGKVAKLPAAGQAEKLERWVEFLQGLPCTSPSGNDR